MKKMWIGSLLLSAAVCFAGAGGADEKAPGGAPPPAREAGQPLIEVPAQVIFKPEELAPVGARLRIASYNIENLCDGRNDGPDAMEAAVATKAKDAGRLIDRIAPDILLLEEVENGAALIQLNQALEKPFPLGYVSEFNSVEGGGEVKLNIAVLSRVPLSGLRELDFGSMQMSPRPPRGALSCQAELGAGKRLLLYGVHLKSNFGDKRKNEWRRMSALKIVRADADAVRKAAPDVEWETLVAGDMNMDPTKPEFAGDKSLQPFSDWVDLWKDRPLAERITVPTRYGEPAMEFPPATLDRFIASPELAAQPWAADAPQALQEGVATNDVTLKPGFGGHVSDHHPIYVDVIRE